MRRVRGFEGARRSLLVALALLGYPNTACRRSTPEASDGVAAGSAPAASARTIAAPSITPSAALPDAPPPKVPCRVSTGTGRLEAPSSTLGPRSELNGKRFVVLAEGERISLRHERTQRELSLLGPGRFLPCVRGDELVLVIEGGVKSSPGVGVHAGGEVVLATPFGLVRYADAAADLKVTASRLSLKVQAGEASFDPAPRKATEAVRPKAVRGPNGSIDATKTADAEIALERCRSAETSSRALEKPPRPAGSARAALGTWAVESFEARRRARLACALARVVIAGRPLAERRRLEDLLESRESDAKGAALAPPAEKK